MFYHILKVHWKINNKSSLKSVNFSLERRWSSRTFRYGYLVTTSPQSLILPSTAASINSWLTGFGYSQLSWCDGRCVQGPGTYSRQYADLPLLAIPTSWRRISAFNPNWDRFLGFASYHYVASLCYGHCSTCVAQDIKGMMIWRHPHLPPIYYRQSLQSSHHYVLATENRGCARCRT